MPNVDYYKILGLDPECTMTEIKVAYRDMARKYHPDNGVANDQLMKLVNEAYGVYLIPTKDFTMINTVKLDYPQCHLKLAHNRELSRLGKPASPKTRCVLEIS